MRDAARNVTPARLTREAVRMGFRDKMREAAAEKEAENAQEAWDAGSRAFVCRVAAMTSNNPKGVTTTLDAILAIGWQLHSTAAAFNTTGLNTEVLFFTFLRP
jgi:hypothetical protein